MPKQPDDSDRIKLPLDFETAVRDLLATKPPPKPVEKAKAPTQKRQGRKPPKK